MKKGHSVILLIGLWGIACIISCKKSSSTSPSQCQITSITETDSPGTNRTVYKIAYDGQGRVTNIVSTGVNAGIVTNRYNGNERS